MLNKGQSQVFTSNTIQSRLGQFHPSVYLQAYSVIAQHIKDQQQMLNAFLKVAAPSNEQQSPRHAESPVMRQVGKLDEKMVGDYLVRAESITEDSIDGYAEIILKGKVIFQGEMIRSRKNGYGIEYTINKQPVYEGFFRGDLYDGWGRTSLYTGQFRDGLYDGYGIYSSKDTYYQGFFLKGLQNGEGISFKGSEMKKFEAVKNIYDFLNEGLKMGINTLLKENKIEEIYLGEWKEGAKHGFGRKWTNEYWYSGQFSNDVPHGLGAEQIKKDNEHKVVQTVYKLGVKK